MEAHHEHDESNSHDNCDELQPSAHSIAILRWRPATETPVGRAVAENTRDRTIDSYSIMISLHVPVYVVRLRDTLGGDAHGVVLGENWGVFADGFCDHVGGLVHGDQFAR